MHYAKKLERWGLISKNPGCLVELRMATEKNMLRYTEWQFVLLAVLNYYSFSFMLMEWDYFPLCYLTFSHIFPTHHIHSIHQIYSHFLLFMALLLLAKERRKDEENIVLYQAPSRLLPSFVVSRESQCWRELVQKYYYLFILWIHPQKFHYTSFMMVRTLITNQNGYKNIF